MKLIINFIYYFLLVISFAWGQTPIENEQAFHNYENIKKVLIEDNLSDDLAKKGDVVKLVKNKRGVNEKERFNYPNEKIFWGFLSEYWLVKNAQVLQWDFPKPDYGLKIAFTGLLEKLGFLNHKFKILVLNAPTITHLALPSNPGESLHLISLPFMRTLDLSKVEISLLLLEDFIRLDEKHFQKNLSITPKYLGENFYNKKFDLKNLNELMSAYSKIAFEKGFNFEQQYQVTKRMDQILKTYPELWSAYIVMLNKIDRLVKMNFLYKDYNNFYPSPELQIKWIGPEKAPL